MPNILGGQFTRVDGCEHGMKLVSRFEQPRGHRGYHQLHATIIALLVKILAPFPSH